MTLSRITEAEYLRLEREAEFRSMKEAAGISADIKLPSLGIDLPLAEVFAKVQFTPSPLRPRPWLVNSALAAQAQNTHSGGLT